MRHVVSTLLILMGLTLLACGSPEALTLEQYLALCDTSDESRDLEPGTTWGELRGDFTEAMDRYADKEPPAELRAYHKAALEQLRALVQALEDKDADQPIDLAGFATLAALAEPAGEKFKETKAALPADLRQRLEHAGC